MIVDFVIGAVTISIFISLIAGAAIKWADAEDLL